MRAMKELVTDKLVTSEANLSEKSTYGHPWGISKDRN